MPFKFEAMSVACGFEYSHALGHHFCADTVAWDNGYSKFCHRVSPGARSLFVNKAEWLGLMSAFIGCGYSVRYSYEMVTPRFRPPADI
jgi:hypothetical protein